ncbi:MAG: cob(I)yrinic acid a,c-diamide adenosyltransferase [Bacteroidales bacterium]|nr:cob(I)yrinic acid a,c-diamide adenosyltransferase [Bacteroidales bacterium]MCL2133742.1 cob(I)yrinic acid a,c-diamide adenosyltransferase [Bacteroidales bacterium]
MKIYTKTGDKGATSLMGGAWVSKTDPRVEAYGTVDELISHLGLLRAWNNNHAQNEEILQIQQCLMNISALLAADEKTTKVLPKIQLSDIQQLENSIDVMNKDLPPLRSFVIPSPPDVAAQCHVSRTVCRRTERMAIAAGDQFAIAENIIPYLNRLSDYLFVLARKLEM